MQNRVKNVLVFRHSGCDIDVPCRCDLLYIEDFTDLSTSTRSLTFLLARFTQGGVPRGTLLSTSLLRNGTSSVYLLLPAVTLVAG